MSSSGEWDWATMQVARTRKEPPEKGGWNLFHTLVAWLKHRQPSHAHRDHGRRATGLDWLA
jgi:hypothetical protein